MSEADYLRIPERVNMAWQAPGKRKMQDGLDNLEHTVRANADSVLTGQPVDAELVDRIRPDLLIWATGAVQNIPDIDGLDSQYTMTSLEYFRGDKPAKGPRVLVIGAGGVGYDDYPAHVGFRAATVCDAGGAERLYFGNLGIPAEIVYWDETGQTLLPVFKVEPNGDDYGTATPGWRFPFRG